MAILQSNLSNLSKEQLIAQIEAMQKAAAGKVTLKVTEKGGVSLYGMGRFPVTLYASQWDKLLANVDTIKAFLEANRSKLATKD